MTTEWRWKGSSVGGFPEEEMKMYEDGNEEEQILSLGGLPRQYIHGSPDDLFPKGRMGFFRKSPLRCIAILLKVCSQLSMRYSLVQDILKRQLIFWMRHMYVITVACIMYDERA